MEPTQNGYKFIKEIASTTKAKAWHIKVNGISYQVVCAPYPRLFNITTVHLATNTGKIKPGTQPLFCLKGDMLNEAAEEVIHFLKGQPTLTYYTIPAV